MKGHPLDAMGPHTGMLVGGWYVVRRLIEDRTQVQYLQYVSPEGTYRQTAATLPPPVPGLDYADAYQLLDREEARETQTGPLDGHWFLLGPGPLYLYGADVPRRRRLDIPEYVIGWVADGPNERWQYLVSGLRGALLRFAASGTAEEFLENAQANNKHGYPYDQMRVIPI